MFSYSALPTSLLALLFTLPVLTAPTTPNDPFHDIAVHVPKPAEEPMCCLRPLSPLEPAQDEDILLSFEDWKNKRLAEMQDQAPPPTVPPPVHPPRNSAEALLDPLPNASDPSAQAQGAVAVEPSQSNEVARIPLTDRFNYASLDCSARVHGSHKSAKGASSILSSKKDRYMLSPCAEKKQFVVVELCEDIRIDTVQLANYEFFSGVFKDFTVSFAKTYTTDPEAWTVAGTYRAKNSRGVQSFHPPPSMRGFYRFIRIDFHSHYGSEYYCPVSLLRVYGLTHLQEWQWETWEAESKARRHAEEASSAAEHVAEPPQPVPLPPPEDTISSESIATTAELPGDASSSTPPVELLGRAVRLAETPMTSTDLTHPDTTVSPSEQPTRLPSDTPTTSPSVSLLTSLSSSPSASVSDDRSVIVRNNNNNNSPNVPPLPPSSAASREHSSAHGQNASLSVIPPSIPLVIPSPAASSGGESVYRMIMNQLKALEANTTLYARYVEEQTAGVREVLRRLTEDVGRLDGIGKAQAQLHQRSVLELEKQTKRLVNEHRELLSKVSHLTDEVMLEKRLGIAQLCLLLAVLIFMALTRGSRGEHVYNVRAGTSWRRRFRISGDFMSRLRGRSATPSRNTDETPTQNDIAFPSNDRDPLPQRRGHIPAALRIAPRSRTPSIRTPTSRHFPAHLATPTRNTALRPGPLQRANSGSMAHGFGGFGPMPTSAKRWARSAHLHEIKVGGANARSQRSHERGDGAALSVSDAAQSDGDVSRTSDAGQTLLLPPLWDTHDKGKAKVRMFAAPRRGRRPGQRGRAESDADGSEGDAWVDTDADVDGSELECASEASAGVALTRERIHGLAVPAQSSL